MKFLNGIWKVLSWFVGFKKQYHKQQKEYQKSQKTTKIIVYFILPLIFTGAGIALELFTFKIFESSFGWGIVGAIFTVALISVSVKTNTLNSVIAFINIARTKAGNAVANIVKSQENTSQSEDLESALKEAISEDIIDATQQKAGYKKWVDLFVGIGCLILAVGLFITSIVLLILRIKYALFI